MPTRQRRSTALLQRPRRHWAAMLERVLQRLEVPSLSNSAAGVTVLRAAVLVCVPQHLEVPSPSSTPAGVAVPHTAVLVRVPQHLEV
eukprot:CAMPEP_0180026290 /NCGR_PEP_ID=MMETSP0984-20121128/25108_1 /TAXON_ID=483367 /ORGANISM="non described non described, Strain CCMP 2436" /LENGTH=86 /DNA_ID=CAMNT_0021950975 /DNA_START=222 /DNA_END=479 /DNA_ORIENTATION=+